MGIFNLKNFGVVNFVVVNNSPLEHVQGWVRSCRSGHVTVGARDGRDGGDMSMGSYGNIQFLILFRSDAHASVHVYVISQAREPPPSVAIHSTRQVARENNKLFCLRDLASNDISNNKMSHLQRSGRCFHAAILLQYCLYTRYIINLYKLVIC